MLPTFFPADLAKFRLKCFIIQVNIISLILFPYMCFVYSVLTQLFGKDFFFTIFILNSYHFGARDFPKIRMCCFVIIRLFFISLYISVLLNKITKKQCIITLFMWILPCNHAESESLETALHAVCS